MPITEELKNVKKFESVGFSHEQSEVLADVIEQSHAQSQENLKEFIRNEITGLRNEIKNEVIGIRNEIKNEIKDLEVRLMISQKDLLIKIFGIIVGTVGIAVAILKLF